MSILRSIPPGSINTNEIEAVTFIKKLHKQNVPPPFYRTPNPDDATINLPPAHPREGVFYATVVTLKTNRFNQFIFLEEEIKTGHLEDTIG